MTSVLVFHSLITKRWGSARQYVYTLPGSNWRPSACEADVIATRPQVLGFIGHSLQPSRPRFVFGDPASPSSPCTRGGLPPACSNSLMHPVAWECSAWSIRIIFTMASTACPLRTMTPAGLEPAIPSSVGRCLIHWATGPDDDMGHVNRPKEQQGFCFRSLNISAQVPQSFWTCCTPS